MSEKEFMQVFSKRLRYYLDFHGITQTELSQRLNVSTATIYNWLHAIKSPRMDKVDKMCAIFGCRRIDLITENPESNNSITAFDLELLAAYHSADPGTQSSVLKLLDLETVTGKKQSSAS